MVPLPMGFAALLGGLVIVVHHAEVSPGDFASGMPVQSTLEHPLQRVLLTEEFYRGVTRDDLSDCAVFNAKGEIVPHAIRSLEPDGSVVVTEVPLPHFPLGEVPSGTNLSLLFERSESGSLLRVRHESKSPPHARVVVLDATALRDPVEGLKVEWQPGTARFLTKVTVEGSEDLLGWTPLAEGVLAELEYAGSALRRDVLTFGAPSRYRYLRLRFADDPMPTIVEVKATRDIHRLAETKQRLVQGVMGEDGAYLFDVGGPIPVVRAHLELSELNTLVRATLSSSSSDAGPWRQRARGLTYRVRMQNEEWTSPPWVVSPEAHRWWRLNVDGGVMPGAPALTVEWSPQHMWFLARGDGPFTVAYGSARVGGNVPAPGRFSPEELMAFLPEPRQGDLNDVTGTLGAPESLGGPAALREVPSERAWVQYALWALLLAVVLVLAFMARRLFKELDRDGATRERL